MMEEGQGSSSNKVPAFLTKTYNMVEDPSTDAFVSWGATNESFIVWNHLDFEKYVLPQYFNHNNFSSFIRQLNTYGFRKIGKLWEFANDDFVRNQKHLIKNIRRGKTVCSRSSQNAHGQGVAAPVAETDRQTLNANIQNLKHDTEQMFLELKRKEEVKKMHEITSQYLKGRLETLERNHQSVLSSVGQKLEKPENEFSIWLLTKTTERKRKGRIRRNNPFCNAASIEDHVGTSHVIHKENNPSVSRLSLNMENLNLLESSMTFWEKITDDVGAEVQPKSLEVDMNSMPVVVVPDPVATEPDGVVIPNHVATEPAIIDASDLVAVEPTDAVVPDFVEPKEQPVTSPVTTGYNNEFWGQYLQEESENEDIPS